MSATWARATVSFGARLEIRLLAVFPAIFPTCLASGPLNFELVATAVPVAATTNAIRATIIDGDGR